MVEGYNREVEKTRFAELLEAAQDELVDAVQQRESLEYKIRKLQEDIGHLAPLAGVEVEDPIKDLGLTDAIRYVLGQAQPKHLSVIEIKDALAAAHYGVDEYSNALAAIHTVIKRLLKKKQIQPSLVTTTTGKKYRWVGGLPPPPPLPDWVTTRKK